MNENIISDFIHDLNIALVMTAYLTDNYYMTRTERNHIFTWACLIALVLFTPRVCAQTAAANAQEAARTRQTFVDYGKKYIGCPYVSGATGPNAFDCSGFVYAVARESIGYQIPRMVKNIYKYCTIIDDSKREIGDLVFFKTTASEDPSHIGIYIGNNQFLNCASDGPNTGVILSSLKEGYWKGKYYKTGRFLPPSKVYDQTSSASAGSSGSSAAKGSSLSNSSGPQASASPSSFKDKIILDGLFTLDWNFFTPDYFRLTFRGLSATLHAMYDGAQLKPGIGSALRWDTGTGVLELPLLFSLTMNEYMRIFAGPVITLGTPYLPGDKDKEIKASFFPGILGINFYSPSIKAGKAAVSFMQDIHYTVFNDRDGSAMSAINSLGTGLVLSTGLRVTLPLASLLK